MIVLDTNALMMPVECEVRLFEELDRLLTDVGGYLAPEAVRDELDKLADGAERDRAELDLRVALGTAEMAVKGWAADEIVEVLDPAVALAKKLGDDFSLGLSLFSIWIYHATRADLTTSQT